MPNEPASEQLGNKRYLIVVLRLLVSEQGELRHGELVDASGLTIGTFRKLDEIPDLILRWLEEWEPEEHVEDRNSVRSGNAGG